MTITAVEKTQGSQVTPATSQATASVIPTSNRGYVLWVNSASAATAVAPSGVTGMGMSWTKVLEVTSPNGSQTLSAWRALSATPTTGALTMTWAAAFETITWKLDELDNIDVAGFIRTSQNFSLATNALAPSGNLPASVSTGNAVISAVAYAGGATQSIDVTPGTGYALLGANVLPGGSPATQLATEFNAAPANNTISWTSTNTNNKAVIALEFAAAVIAPTTQVLVTERTSGGTTTPTTANNTASVAPVANRGYLLWVGTAHATAAVAPSSVTGMGMTWVKHLEITSSNGFNNLSLWRASNFPSGATTGALTINYAAAPFSVAWKLDQLEGANPGGTAGSGMIRAANNYTQAVAASLPSGSLALLPTVNDGVISGMTYNAGVTQSMSAGAGFTLLGTPVQNAGSTPLQLGTQYDQDGGSQTIAWTSTSGSSKAIIAVELVANSSQPVVNAGGDQTVDGFDLVNLVSSVSSGTPPYSHAWTGPGGITILNAGTAGASFRAPPSLTNQTYTFTDTVTDSATQVGTDTVDVTVLAYNLWTRRSGVLVGRRVQTRRAGVLVG